MTKKSHILILLAVVTALILPGCGQIEDSQVSSDTIHMETWGDTIDPAATPSMGQVLPDAQTTENQNPDYSMGNTTISGQGDENESATQPPQSAQPSSTTSKKPSGGGNTAVAPSASPSSSPAIAPPAPASSATIDDVQGYVGKQLSSLIEDLGYPLSSDYELVDEDDPDQGELGTLRFNGFTVSTLRTDSGESITAVTPKG